MRKISLILVLLGLAFLLGGCWDNREIDDLGLVMAVGVDKGETDNTFSVTIQIANPTASESGGAKINIWVGTAEGDSIFDAVRTLGNISSKRIMWAHNSVVIIGESLARQGISPVIDFFTHNPELRMKTIVVVSRGDAKPYLTSKVGLDNPPGAAFAALQSYNAFTAKSVSSQMLDISASIRNEFGNPLIASIDFKQATTQSQDGDIKKDEGDTINLEGSALFKRDKMLGWLSAEESQGVAFMLNQTKYTLVTVEMPEYQNKSVSVQTYGLKSSIKTSISDGMPIVLVKLSGSGEIVEEDGSTTMDMKRVKKRLGTMVSTKIREEILKSVAAMQSTYGVDALGLSAYVHAQNPKEWKEGLKDRWVDNFPKVQVVVTVDIKISGSTLNQIPLNVS